MVLRRWLPLAALLVPSLAQADKAPSRPPPAVSASPSATPIAASPTAPASAVKSSGCSLPGGTEPATGVVMALAGLLALGGRRSRSAKRGA